MPRLRAQGAPPGREAQVMAPGGRRSSAVDHAGDGEDGGGVARGGDFEFEPEGANWVRRRAGDGGGGAAEPVGAAEYELAIESTAAGDTGRIGVGAAQPRLRGFADPVCVELDGGFAVGEAEAHGLAVEGEIVVVRMTPRMIASARAGMTARCRKASAGLMRIEWGGRRVDRETHRRAHD